MGSDGSVTMVGYWYPQLCVYDDVAGWQIAAHQKLVLSIAGNRAANGFRAWPDDLRIMAHCSPVPVTADVREATRAVILAFDHPIVDHGRVRVGTACSHPQIFALPFVGIDLRIVRETILGGKGACIARSIGGQFVVPNQRRFTGSRPFLIVSLHDSRFEKCLATRCRASVPAHRGRLRLRDRNYWHCQQHDRKELAYPHGNPRYLRIS